MERAEKERKKIPGITCTACDKIMERALVGLTFSQDIIIFDTAIFPSSQSAAALHCSAGEKLSPPALFILCIYLILFLKMRWEEIQMTNAFFSPIISTWLFMLLVDVNCWLFCWIL